MEVLETFYELIKGIFSFLINLPGVIIDIFEFLKILYLELPAFVLSFFSHLPGFVQSGFTIVVSCLLLVLILKFYDIIMKLVR